MIGLEYVLKLFNMTQQELANKLEIKQQNIDAWIKGKRNIPNKHLPKLVEIFNIPVEYFQKELTDIDKLIIQKEKLKEELKPNIKNYQMTLVFDKDSNEADLDQVPIYDQNEINDIDIEIQKIKALEKLKEAISTLNADYEISTIEQIAMIIKEHGKERLFIDTIDALSHYYNVLPEWVGDPDSDEFVDEFLKLAEKHEKV